MLAGEAALDRPHPLCGRERLLLELPDPLGGVAGSLRAGADLDYLLAGKVGVGDPLDLLRLAAVTKQLADCLDDVAAIEVRCLLGQLALEVICRDPPTAGRMLAVAGGHDPADHLTVDVELFRFGLPALLQCLVREIAFLGAPGVKRGDLAGTR